MGASESKSTTRSTNNDEEPNQENNSSMSAMTAIATAAAGVAVAAWGISKMLSDNKDTEEANLRVRQPSVVNSPRIVYEAMNRRSIWSPPPRGRFKMNTDGACRPRFVGNMFSPDGYVQRGPSGYGGILRDDYGRWVQGFIGFIGEADCLTSEFHGILKGLELLDKLKLHGSILETDSQAAYEWVIGHGDNPGKSSIIQACWSTIDKCRKLIGKNDIDVQLVKGEANRCADKLADMAIERGEPYVEFKDRPHQLMDLV